MTIYEKIDNFMMAGANKLVRAWNWTTGRTKSDLATLLNTSGWALITSGTLVRNSVGIIIAPLAVFLSYSHMKKFHEIEDLENGAKESNAKNYFAESAKQYWKFTTPLYFGFGTLDYSISAAFVDDEKNPNRQLGNLLSGTGWNLIGASVYVINADNLPPRKNCLSRGLDYLVESIRSYKTEPALAPIPIN